MRTRWGSSTAASWAPEAGTGTAEKVAAAEPVKSEEPAPADRAERATTRWFEEVYEAERPQLYRLARLLSASDVIAEEVVQDAFVRVHLSGRIPANPPAYLRSTVANLCRNYLRRRDLERRVPLPRSGPALNPEIDETWAALSKLPYRQRAVLVLRYYQDLSEAEIAETLDCPIGTVKSSLHRALDKLRKELSQ